MKLKFLFTAALAVMALTSCQKDEAEQGSVQPGQDTYIGMTIQLPKSVVFRTFNGDVNATEAERKLSYVTVGVWSDGDVAVTYTDLVVSELTNNNDGTYTATKAVKAKTGTNNIIVLANTDAKPTIPQINGTAFNALVTEIAKDNNFVMYSDAVKVMTNVEFASKDEVEGAKTGDDLLTSNKTSVTLCRAAAKVAVTSSLDATDDTGVADGLGNGKLTNIVWNIANQNEQMTIFPRFVTGTDFIASNVNSPFTRLTPGAPATVLPKSGDAAAVEYCLENAHGTGTDVYKENNTTAVQVSAIFAPDADKYVSTITGATSDDAVIAIGTTDMTPGDTFYVSKVDVGTTFAGAFFAEAAVDGVVTAFGVNKDTDFVKYDGGKCFWAIWINDGAAKPSYGVLRNHMYTMNIKSIKAPGFAEFPDTDKPIPTNAFIQIDLSVKEWTNSNMGEVEM